MGMQLGKSQIGLAVLARHHPLTMGFVVSVISFLGVNQALAESSQTQAPR
jgi:hypothetical protein